MDELQAVITRITQDNDRLRTDRDEQLATLAHLGELIEQARRASRGTGSNAG